MSVEDCKELLKKDTQLLELNKWNIRRTFTTRMFVINKLLKNVFLANMHYESFSQVYLFFEICCLSEIFEGSPLIFVNVNDVVVELQKKKVKNSNQFISLVKDVIRKKEKTLYLAIYNSNNQRTYITVKLQ